MAAPDIPPDLMVQEERRARDAQAEAYDLHTTRQEWEYAVMDECLRRTLAPRLDDRVVDAGCGTGRHLPWLAENAALVVGVDHSPRSLKLARQKLTPEQAVRVDLIEGDLRALPLEDQSAERLLCVGVIQHVPTADFRRQVAREFLRVLKPGGVAVLTGYKWLGHQGWRRDGSFEADEGRVPFHAFTSRELRGLLAAAGFIAVDVGGAAILPPLSKRLGMSPEAQARLAFTPFLRHLGEYLVARAVRPARK